MKDENGENGGFRAGPSTVEGRCGTGEMKVEFSILVTDRNGRVRDFLQRELCEEGYRVHTVRDGRELLRMLDEETRLDLLVLDVEIPYADGSAILVKSGGKARPGRDHSYPCVGFSGRHPGRHSFRGRGGKEPGYGRLERNHSTNTGVPPSPVIRLGSALEPPARSFRPPGRTALYFRIQIQRNEGVSGNPLIFPPI